MTDHTRAVTWWAEGTWTGVVTSRAMMLLPPQVSEDLVERLWRQLRSDEASLTQALEELVTGTGGRLAAVPDFALAVRAADDTLHVALRGAAQLEVDGKALDALRVTTWLETAFQAPRTVVASAPERPGPVRRPVADAVVLAGSLAVGADGDRGAGGSRGAGGQAGAAGSGQEEDGEPDPDPADPPHDATPGLALAGYGDHDGAGDLAGDFAGDFAGDSASDFAGDSAGDLAGDSAGDLGGARGAGALVGLGGGAVDDSDGAGAGHSAGDGADDGTDDGVGGGLAADGDAEPAEAEAVPAAGHGGDDDSGDDDGGDDDSGDDDGAADDSGTGAAPGDGADGAGVDGAGVDGAGVDGAGVDGAGVDGAGAAAQPLADGSGLLGEDLLGEDLLGEDPRGEARAWAHHLMPEGEAQEPEDQAQGRGDAEEGGDDASEASDASDADDSVGSAGSDDSAGSDAAGTTAQDPGASGTGPVEDELAALLLAEDTSEATTGPVDADEAAPGAADPSALVLSALAEVAPRAGGAGGLSALRADAPAGLAGDLAAGGLAGGEAGTSAEGRDGGPDGEEPGRQAGTAADDLAPDPGSPVTPRGDGPEPAAGTDAAGSAFTRTRRSRRLDAAPARRAAGRHSWEPTVVPGGSDSSASLGGSLGMSSSPLLAGVPDVVASPEPADTGGDLPGGVALVALPSQSPQATADTDGGGLPSGGGQEARDEHSDAQVPGDHDGHTITSLPEDLSEELRAELLSQGVTPDNPPAQAEAAHEPGVPHGLPAVGSQRPWAGPAPAPQEQVQPRVASATRVAPHGDHDGHTVSGLPEDLVGELISLVGGAPGQSRAASPSAPVSPAPAQGSPASTASPASTRTPEVRVVLSAVCGNGHPNPTNYTVCRECGADLNRPAKSVACPPLGRLVTSSGERIDLDRPVLVGRNPVPADVTSSSEVPVRVLTVPSPNQLVSRNHVLIDLDAWSVLAQDLGNCNGTVLNRNGEAPVRLAASSPVLLRTGDVLEVGDGQILTFENLP